jgi:hypothetical protein
VANTPSDRLGLRGPVAHHPKMPGDTTTMTLLMNAV